MFDKNNTQDQSFLDINFEDTYEPHTVPGDTEYQLRIISAKMKRNKKDDHDMIALYMDIPDEPEAKELNHYLMLPNPQVDEAKTINRYKNDLRKFCEAFDIPCGNGINLANFAGSTGWCILREEETDEYGLQNSIKSVVSSR